MKAAEILGLVSTPAGDVVLEPLGKQFLDATSTSASSCCASS